MITQDKFSTIAHNVKSVGPILLRDGKLTAFERPDMDHDSILELLAYTWNDLGDLVDEMTRMSDDHDRMTNTLHRIGALSIDAMRCTSRLSIPTRCDWLSSQDTTGLPTSGCSS